MQHAPRNTHHAPRSTQHVIVCLLCTLILLWLAAAAAPHPTQAEPPRNDRLGIVHINSTEISASPAGRAERYRLAAEAGAGWSRWPVYWDLIESSAGFDWSGADAVMIGDLEYGFQVDAILLRTPPNYATGGLAGVPGPRVGQKRPVGRQLLGPSRLASVPVNLYAPVFSDGTDVPGPGKTINPQNYWARFVFKAVNRYKPGGELAAQRGWLAGRGVRAWEVWNEPDWSFFWTGPVADYYRLLKVAHLAARQADPQAEILIGGLMHWADPGWLERLLEEMQRDPDKALATAHGFYFDVVPFHWYSDPRHQFDRTGEARALLSRYGLGDKRLWVNESNVPIWDDYPGPTHDSNSPGRATIQEAADYIVQATAYAFAAGVERAFTFQLHDDCGNGPDSYDAFGLVRNTAESVGSGVCAPHPTQPGVPRPAYTAYRMTAQQLNDTTFAWRLRSGDVEEIAFTRPPGDTVRVVWNWSKTPVTVSITATAASVLRIDPLGVTTVLSATNGVYNLTLPGATNVNSFGAPGTVMIGGRPYFIVEQTGSCTADTTPPTSSIEPLPPTSLARFTLRWSGQDDCAVSHYLVWWTDGDPATANKRRFFDADPNGWTARTQAIFPDDLTGQWAGFQPQPGHTYYFGVLAYDAAGNREANATGWRTKAWTTVGGSGVIEGHVFDHRNQPLAGAGVTVLDPVLPAMFQATSDAAGFYRVVELPAGGSGYRAQATAPGWGAWPFREGLTAVASGTAQTDFYLPPAFNVIQNGGFEQALSGWTLGGSTPPQVVSQPSEGIAVKMTRGAGFRACLAAWKGCPTRGFYPNASAASSGLRAAVLGQNFVGQPDLAGGGNSTLSQVVTIGSGWISPTLSLVYRRQTAETTPGHDWFEVLVINAGQRTDLLRRDWGPSTGWRFAWYDLSPWRGQTVTIVFNLWQSSADRPTLIWLDEVAVGPGQTPALTPRLFLPFLANS
jgi:hypothetical protein